MMSSDIIDFQRDHILNKSTTITILTDIKRINMEDLKQYGEIIILDKEDILN